MIPVVLQAALKAHGWQVSPNNIHGLAGFEVVPAGPGAWQPADFTKSIRFLPAGTQLKPTVPSYFAVLQMGHTTMPNGFLAYHHTEVFRASTADDLVAWLQVNGKQSEGGMPGYANGWD